MLEEPIKFDKFFNLANIEMYEIFSAKNNKQQLNDDAKEPWKVVSCFGIIS